MLVWILLCGLAWLVVSLQLRVRRLENWRRRLAVQAERRKVEFLAAKRALEGARASGTAARQKSDQEKLREIADELEGQ